MGEILTARIGPSEMWSGGGGDYVSSLPKAKTLAVPCRVRMQG